VEKTESLLEESAKYFDKLEQMIRYREGEVERPEKQRVKGLIQLEIDTLIFLAKYAKAQLEAQGITV
jgi:hypothetical protein